MHANLEVLYSAARAVRQLKSPYIAAIMIMQFAKVLAGHVDEFTSALFALLRLHRNKSLMHQFAMLHKACFGFFAAFHTIRLLLKGSFADGIARETQDWQRQLEGETRAIEAPAPSDGAVTPCMHTVSNFALSAPQMTVYVSASSVS